MILLSKNQVLCQNKVGISVFQNISGHLFLAKLNGDDVMLIPLNEFFEPIGAYKIVEEKNFHYYFKVKDDDVIELLHQSVIKELIQAKINNLTI